MNIFRKKPGICLAIALAAFLLSPPSFSYTPDPDGILCSKLFRWISTPTIDTWNKLETGGQNLVAAVKEEGPIRLLTKKATEKPDIILWGLMTAEVEPENPYRWYQVWRNPVHRVVQGLPRSITRAKYGKPYAITLLRFVGYSFDRLVLAEGRTTTFGVKLAAGLGFSYYSTPYWMPWYYAGVDWLARQISGDESKIMDLIENDPRFAEIKADYHARPQRKTKMEAYLAARKLFQDKYQYLKFVEEDPRFERIKIALHANPPKINEAEAASAAAQLLGALNEYTKLQNAVSAGKIKIFPDISEDYIRNEIERNAAFAEIKAKLGANPPGISKEEAYDMVGDYYRYEGRYLAAISAAEPLKEIKSKLSSEPPQISKENAIMEAKKILAQMGMISIEDYNARLLTDPRLQPVFGHIPRLVTTDWSKNPNMLSIPVEERVPQREQLGALVQNTERKLQLQYFASVWFSKNPKLPDPVKNKGAWEAYTQLRDDPYWQKLVELRNLGKLTDRQLQMRLIEDLEWQEKLTSYKIVGVGLSLDVGSQQIMSIDDIRADILSEISENNP